MLLLHANEVASRDELVDALWGERVPPSAAESLDAYVYRLRKLLGHDCLTRQPGGYVLRVEPGELDANEFERLLASARRAAEAGDHGAAAAALAEALGLWHGSAWADMLELPLASVEARRLEGLRLSALESRIESDLAEGGGAALVPELEQLVSEHPRRERLVAGLMLALYRSGRLAPFDNVLARKALNYGIDRRVIARMYGGPAFATPTCQPLAPDLPGYRRYCPYTAHPTTYGT